MRAYFAAEAADRAARIEAAFADAWRSVGEGPPPPARARPAAAVDWLARWRASARPLEAAPGVWVAPPGAELPAPAREPGARVVVILPGQGFGTGTHPTTRALLGWLAREPAGGDVLDVGTGSGILALAALALGARSSVAVELDAAAVENAAANRALNASRAGGFLRAGRLHVVHGTLDAVRPGRRFQRVLANLDRATLGALLPDLARRVAPGGRLGVAGILRGEEEEVLALAAAARLDLADSSVDHDPASVPGGASDAWWSGWLAPAAAAGDP